MDVMLVQCIWLFFSYPFAGLGVIQERQKWTLMEMGRSI